MSSHIDSVIGEIRNLIFGNDEIFTNDKQLISLIENAGNIDGVTYNKEVKDNIICLSTISHELIIDCILVYDSDDRLRYVYVIFIFDDVCASYEAISKVYQQGYNPFIFYEIDDSVKESIIDMSKSRKHNFACGVLLNLNCRSIYGNEYKKIHMISKVKSAK